MIKQRIIFLLGMTAFTVNAQHAGMSQEQMQQMMQNAEAMQACFAKVDQQAIRLIGQKANAMEAEIKVLCKAGKSAEARRTAIKFGLFISKDKNVQAARECGEMMKGIMPDMDYPTSDEDFKGEDICDSY